MYITFVINLIIKYLIFKKNFTFKCWLDLLAIFIHTFSYTVVDLRLRLVKFTQPRCSQLMSYDLKINDLSGNIS